MRRFLLALSGTLWHSLWQLPSFRLDLVSTALIITASVLISENEERDAREF